MSRALYTSNVASAATVGSKIKNIQYSYMVAEAILVGVYNLFLYILFSQVFRIKNLYLLLLVVGFSKHFLGYIIGIHTWYCNYGAACLRTNANPKNTYSATAFQLYRSSILEALAELVIGILLSIILTNRYALFFTIGFLLHIVAEYAGIHKQFCRSNCEKNTQ
jgi:hypothetical protein